MNRALFLSQKTAPVIAVMLFACTWYFLWISYVDPFPDRDSINQFYYPFLNFLMASKALTLNYSYLLENTFSTSYPYGGAVFPWLIAQFGLQSAFLENPYLLNLVLILPLATVPLFFRLSGWNRFFLGMLVFSIPFTQILLKGFSLQAFNVGYAVLALLCFRSYLGTCKGVYLLLFVFFFWLAIIPKHLGAFYFLNFCISYGIWCVISRKLDFRVILSLLAIVALSLPFYPWLHLMNYMNHVITHNPYLSVPSFFLFGSLLLLLGCSFLLFVQRKSKNQFLPRFKRAPMASLILFLLATYLTTVSYDAELGNQDLVIFFLLGYGFCSFLLLRYRLSNIRGFMVLLCLLTYLHSTLLFCSMIGKTYYSFFLPLILVAILEFVESKEIWKRATFVITTLLISNFFPSISSLKVVLGERGENIYINGFNAPYMNPLGWERCEIPSIRNSIAALYSKVDLGKKSNAYIAERIHFHTKLALEFPYNYLYPFPSIYRLDNLSEPKIQALVHGYREKGEELFQQWLEEGTIPILILGKNPYTSLVGDPPKMSEILGSEEPDLNDFSRSLGFDYLQYVEQTGDLYSRYRCRSLPQDNPRVEICLFKDLPKEESMPGQWNQSLADLAMLHEMRNNRTSLPPWIRHVPLHNRVQIERKWAGFLYEQADELRERKDLSGAYCVLRRVLNLDPSHAGALEDVLGLQEDMTPEDWERVPNNYAPLDAEKLEHSLMRSISLQQEDAAENLGENLSVRERAHQLFILSNYYFNRDPEHCMRLLKEALGLDPEHVEARKDLDIVLKKVKLSLEKGKEK